MGNSLNTLLALVMVISATVLIPFISIRFFLKEIDVLPSEGMIIATTSFRTRLWASLLGLTFIGFPAGKAVSSGDISVTGILASYSQDWILYSLIFILLIGLVAGMVSRRPHCGAMASATSFLCCTWLGAYMTPEILTLSLNARIASVELTNLISSLMVSQLLGGCAGALLSAMMGAIGGALMGQRRTLHQESLGDVGSQINGRPRLRLTPFLMADRNRRSDVSSSKWSLCPRCGASLVWLFDERQYHCSNCSGSNSYHSL